MKNQIDLQIHDDIIVAIYTGPHASAIYDLFGTVILPTAYRKEYGLTRAADQMRRMNPDCVVYQVKAS